LTIVVASTLGLAASGAPGDEGREGVTMVA